MATIVRDIFKDRLYVLVGVGYGASESTRPSAMTPLMTTRTSKEAEMVAVANRDGEIQWLSSSQLSVVSVDGSTCRELIQHAHDQQNE